MELKAEQKDTPTEPVCSTDNHTEGVGAEIVESTEDGHEDNEDIDLLTQSFSGGLRFGQPIEFKGPQKRNYSDNAWAPSPLGKKLDIDETPIFDRGVPVSPIPGPPPISFTPSPTKYALHRGSKLLVVGSVSAEHDTGHHQENSQRTCLLCGEDGCLRRAELDGVIDWVDSATLPHPAIADLLRVHDYAYLQHLENRAKETVPHYAPRDMLDIDTPLAPESLSAAKKFCSAAMYAVDAIMSHSTDRAFVIGRPPGHHAGPSGCVVGPGFWQRPGVASSGFCLLNNVAVAAGYARYKYHCKIAIVDIDVHHGNGTEDIVRNLAPRLVHLPLPSSWAPVSKMEYKPWYNEQDDQEVLFASIHKYDGDSFYPATGSESSSTPTILNLTLTPLLPSKKRSKADLIAIASAEFRHKVNSTLLPALRAFAPDLLFISAGFDTHYADAYHYLHEEDIHWVTKEMTAIVDENGGGTVSVLEGGYSLSTPEEVAPVPVAVPAGSMSLRTKKSKEVLQGQVQSGGKEAHKVEQTEKDNRFALRAGDGGLVKGVMAHVAALAKREGW